MSILPRSTPAVFLIAILLSSAGASLAKSASLNAYCLSANLSTAKASALGLSLEADFTTYDGSSGLPLFDSVGTFVVFSGELSPDLGQAGLYRTDYVLFVNGRVDSSGTATVMFPVTDSDGNGVPDFLQANRSGNVNFSGSVTHQLPSSSPSLPMSGQITRTAGSSAGSYLAIVQDITGPVTYRGTSYLLNAVGSVSYERNPQNTATINATISDEDGSTITYSGSSPFSVVNANTITFPVITFSGSNNRSIQAKPFTLTRAGNRYLGEVELQDGGLSTSWRDYIRWRIEIIDSNDSNGNGIPDLTDSSVEVPRITQQPSGATVTVGGSITLSVSATGSAPLSYQWQRNSVNIPSATGPSYSLGNLQPDDAANYRVIVSNAAGSVASDLAVITVIALPTAPVISSQPQSLTVSVGQSAVFSVTATDTTPLTYQWRINGAAISGATSATLNINAASEADTATYTVVVANPAGQVTSQGAVLTVLQKMIAPQITTAPVAATVQSGQPFSFSVTATGTVPLNYQWFKDGTAIPGATQGIFSIATATLASQGDYQVRISNAVGTVTSSAARLTVVFQPTILRIAAIKPLFGGQMELTVETAVGKNYVLEGSIDLKTWAPRKPFSAAATITKVTDVFGDTPQRFYRLREDVPSVLAPEIIRQPRPQTAHVGESVTFSVEIRGTGPFSYQWRKIGTNLSGKTSPTLSIPSVKLSDAGLYRVVITGPGGEIVSEEVLLDVESGQQ